MSFFDVKSIAREVRRAIPDQAPLIGHSQTIEVVVALLGYGTYRAWHTLALAKAQPDNFDHDFLLLCPRFGHLRIDELAIGIGRSDSSAIVSACAEQILRSAQAHNVFVDQDSFIDRQISIALPQVRKSAAVNSVCEELGILCGGRFDEIDAQAPEFHSTNDSIWRFSIAGTLREEGGQDRSGWVVVNIAFECARVGPASVRPIQATVQAWSCLPTDWQTHRQPRRYESAVPL